MNSEHRTSPSCEVVLTFIFNLFLSDCCFFLSNLKNKEELSSDCFISPVSCHLGIIFKIFLTLVPCISAWHGSQTSSKKTLKWQPSLAVMIRGERRGGERKGVGEEREEGEERGVC